MEAATDKQLQLMKNLKLVVPAQLTKAEASKIIEKELAEISKNKPADKPKVSNGKEFHLSIEECRARALESAIKIDDLSLVNQFFNWIFKGELK